MNKSLLVNNDKAIAFMLAGICFVVWPIIFFKPLFIVPLLVLIFLTVLTRWKRDTFTAKQHLLAGSIFGALFQALVLEGYYLRNHSRAPLRADDDGLWVFIFIFIVFWWAVARTAGYVLYRISNKRNY